MLKGNEANWKKFKKNKTAYNFLNWISSGTTGLVKKYIKAKPGSEKYWSSFFGIAGIILGGKFFKGVGGKTKLMSKKAAEKATRASVDKKLAEYLLNPAHSKGGSKAKWYKEALGFTNKNADKLAKQIRFNPKTAARTEVTKYGTKYNQVIKIKGANGKNVNVAFAWIKNKDGVIRLVTAIPTKK